MRSYTVFENTVYRKPLERSFYCFCMFRQLSLIRFFPLYLLLDLLRFFRIIKREKYLTLRWRFLSKVKRFDKRREVFFAKRGRKFILPEKDVSIISDNPDVVFGEYFEELGYSLLCNEYDIAQKSFKDYKRPDEFAEGEYGAIGTLSSPIMKKAAEKHYRYGKRIYKSPFNYFASKSIHYFICYTVMTVYAAVLGVIGLYFASATHINDGALFYSYFDNYLIIALNLLPIIFLCWLCYFIFNNIAVGCTVSAAVFMVLNWVNYYKLYFRNDPFLFEDLTIAMEARLMTESYKIVLTPAIICIIVAIIFMAVCLALYFKAPLNIGGFRWLLAVLMVCIGVFGYNKIYLNYHYYSSTQNFEVTNQWSDTDQYVSRGFIYPFIYSTLSAYEAPPEGYSAKDAEAVLSEYTYVDIPEDKKVNVISIMLESWGDFRRFEELEFIKDPYEPLTEVFENSYTGTLVTDIFSAGTVKSERQFLTGLTDMTSFRKKTNSVAWYFREQGYKVEGGHPSYDWFYNRQNINANLGFENYYFDDNLYLELNGGKRTANNDVMFPSVIGLFDEAMERGEHYFSFNVTYQGHGPYSIDPFYYEPYIADKGYNKASYDVFNNFLDITCSVNMSVAWLAEEVEAREEPLVLILFGDHMPGLGENNSAYADLGINIDLGTPDGFENYYSTPYVILANDAAEEVLGVEFVGQGPTIGPYFLMNEFFRLAGYTGDEYMQYTTDILEKYQVYHSAGVAFKNGEIIMEELPEFAELKKQYDIVQYYWRNNFSTK